MYTLLSVQGHAVQVVIVIPNTPKKLADARRRRKLSQAELAEVVGCTQAMISLVELGGVVAPRTRVEMAAALNIDLTPAEAVAIPEPSNENGAPKAPSSKPQSSGVKRTT